MLLLAMWIYSITIVELHRILLLQNPTICKTPAVLLDLLLLDSQKTSPASSCLSLLLTKVLLLLLLSFPSDYHYLHFIHSCKTHLMLSEHSCWTLIQTSLLSFTFPLSHLFSQIIYSSSRLYYHASLYLIFLTINLYFILSHSTFWSTPKYIFYSSFIYFIHYYFNLN